jgi:hypothetical protein
MTDHRMVLEFQGSRLLVEADERAWLERLVRAFPAFGGESGGRPHDFALTIRETDAPPKPHGLPLTWAGLQPDGYAARISEQDELVILELEDGGTVVIDHDARTAVASLRPGSYAQFFGSPLMLVLQSALAASGQRLIHAACLVERRSGRAVLICVPSGGGKTTTALALAHDGFALITDDAAVLVPDESRPRVWGLPRPLKVHRVTAQLLPWIGPLPDRWDENGEQGVTLESLAGKIEVAPPEPVELGAMFELGPRSADGHKIAPLPKPDMLVGLAHDNVAFRAAGMLPTTLKRYQAFARAVSQAPTFRISAGPDLASLPSMVAAAMNAAAGPGSRP